MQWSLRHILSHSFIYTGGMKSFKSFDAKTLPLPLYCLWGNLRHNISVYILSLQIRKLRPRHRIKIIRRALMFSLLISSSSKIFLCVLCAPCPESNIHRPPHYGIGCRFQDTSIISWLVMCSFIHTLVLSDWTGWTPCDSWCRSLIIQTCITLISLWLVRPQEQKSTTINIYQWNSENYLTYCSVLIFFQFTF